MTVWIALFCLSVRAADQASITVVGEVSDSQCAFDVHSNTGSHEELMKSKLFGSTAAECVHACIRFGGKYVLVDHAKNKIYQIANPAVVAEYAAKQVRVLGTLDQKGMLSIQQIEFAKAGVNGPTKR